jgi:hypothetical protein
VQFNPQPYRRRGSAVPTTVWSSATRKSASIKPATANVVPPLADFLDVTISSSLDAGEVSVLRWYIA